jgi:hypothetical protein
MLLFLSALAASAIAADGKNGEIERLEPPTDKQQLEKARQTIIQLFKKEYDLAVSPAKKQELARTLLENAPRIKDDSEVRYVMLTEAKDYAISSDQIVLTGESIDQLAKYYRLDPIELKIAAFERISKTARGATIHRDIATGALELSKSALQDHRLDDAKRLALLALVSARKSQSMQLIRQCNAALLEIDAARKKGEK